VHLILEPPSVFENTDRQFTHVTVYYDANGQYLSQRRFRSVTWNMWFRVIIKTVSDLGVESDRVNRDSDGMTSVSFDPSSLQRLVSMPSILFPPRCSST
jgi:ribulose bisphosphate carboxylase small subunit